MGGALQGFRAAKLDQTTDGRPRHVRRDRLQDQGIGARSARAVLGHHFAEAGAEYARRARGCRNVALLRHSDHLAHGDLVVVCQHMPDRTFDPNARRPAQILLVGIRRRQEHVEGGALTLPGAHRDRATDAEYDAMND